MRTSFVGVESDGRVDDEENGLMFLQERKQRMNFI